MGSSYHRLNEMLVRPLAVTDLLPIEVNHADKLFEDAGAKDVIKSVLEFVLAEQRRGKAPNLNLIRHAVSHIALPNFEVAYEAALNKVQAQAQTGVSPIKFTGSGWLERANAESLAMEYKPGRPTENLAGVEDVLLFYLDNATTLPVKFDALQLSRYTDSLKRAFEEGQALEKGRS